MALVGMKTVVMGIEPDLDFGLISTVDVELEIESWILRLKLFELEINLRLFFGDVGF